MIEGEGNHFRMFLKDAVDGAPQIADAFAVDDAHLENSALLASCQIIEHELLYLARLEGVQVQHAINWKLDGLIHKPKIHRFSGRERIDSDPFIGLKQSHRNALHNRTDDPGGLR
jgi:hypothetical protein